MWIIPDTLCKMLTSLFSLQVQSRGDFTNVLSYFPWLTSIFFVLLQNVTLRIVMQSQTASLRAEPDTAEIPRIRRTSGLRLRHSYWQQHRLNSLLTQISTANSFPRANSEPLFLFVFLDGEQSRQAMRMTAPWEVNSVKAAGSWRWL